MASSGITKVALCKRKVDPCGVYSLRAKANSALYVQCGKWINSRSTRVKMATPKISINLACKKCEGNIGEVVEQKEVI